MNIEDLNGRKIKKVLEAGSVIKHFHYKYKDGSGNFEFVIKRNGKAYILTGHHDNGGYIDYLQFGDFAYYYKLNLTNILLTKEEEYHFYLVTKAIGDIMNVVENRHLYRK